MIDFHGKAVALHLSGKFFFLEHLICLKWRQRLFYVISLMRNFFCFIFRFYDKRDAEDALDAMDGRILDGRELRVQMARYGRPSSPHRRHGRSNRRR